MQKNILLIVAHPDDETLWFYGGLKQLTQNHHVDILCLTYDAASVRGRELLKAMNPFKANVIFGNLNDSGFYAILKNVESCIEQQLATKKYDIVITHPQHGGEKPHPHHIQCFHITRRLAYEHKIKFGFFTEKKVFNCTYVKRKYKTSISIKFDQFWNYSTMLIYINKNFQLNNLTEIKKEFNFLVKTILKSSYFYFIAFYPNRFQKQSTLSQYESQIHILQKYQAYLNSAEYLYLECHRKTKFIPFLFSYNLLSNDVFRS